MSIVDKALKDSRTALRDSIQHRGVDEPDLDKFQELFRPDYEIALGTNGEAKWQKDYARTTTLARAIGSFAEFLAIAEEERADPPKTVAMSHLTRAYTVLKIHCKDDDTGKVVILREYCTGVSRQLDPAGKE